MLGLGMGMKNSVPYQVGKQLKVGKNLGTEMRVRFITFRFFVEHIVKSFW